MCKKPQSQDITTYKSNDTIDNISNTNDNSSIRNNELDSNNSVSATKTDIEYIILKSNLPQKCKSVCSISLPCGCYLDSAEIKLPFHDNICTDYTQKIEVFQAVNAKHLHTLENLDKRDIYNLWETNYNLSKPNSQTNIAFDKVIADFEYQNLEKIDITHSLQKLRHTNRLSHKFYKKETTDSFNFYGTIFCIVATIAGTMLLIRKILINTLLNVSDKTGSKWTRNTSV